MSSYYTATNDGGAQSALQCAAGGAGFAINGLSTVGQMQAVAAYLAGRLTSLTSNGDASSSMQSRAQANGWKLPGFLSDLGQIETVAANLAGFSVTPTRDGDAQAAMQSAGAARGISFAGLGRSGAAALMLANLTASSVSYSPGGTNYPALTLTRGSTAYYLDKNTDWQSAASNVVRDSAYAYNNNASAYTRVTLLEASAKNLVLQSDALATTWTAVGSPTVTNAAATAANRSFSSIAYATGWGTDYVKQAITFTGNAVKGLSFLFKQSGTAAGTFTVQLYDVTATAAVAASTVTIASDGTMTCSSATGTQQQFLAEDNGVYRLTVQSTSVTAAHTNEVRIGTGGTVTAILVSGVMAVDNVIASSLYPTTTATATRSADVAYLDLAGTALAIPREATFYVKLIELGNLLLGAGFVRVFQLGDDTTAGTTSIAIYAATTGYTGVIYNGSTNSSKTFSVTTPSLNDQVELLLYVDPTGLVTINQAINGVAGTAVTASSAQALQASFKSTKLYLGSLNGSSNFGLAGVQYVKAAVGKQSFATMRNLP